MRLQTKNLNQTLNKSIRFRLMLVRMTGVEPASREALDPKSSVSANFTTSAFFIKNKRVFTYSFGGSPGI